MQIHKQNWHRTTGLSLCFIAGGAIATSVGSVSALSELPLPRPLPGLSLVLFAAGGPVMLVGLVVSLVRPSGSYSRAASLLHGFNRALVAAALVLWFFFEAAPPIFLAAVWIQFLYLCILILAVPGATLRPLTRAVGWAFAAATCMQIWPILRLLVWAWPQELPKFMVPIYAALLLTFSITALVNSRHFLNYGRNL